MQEELVGPNDPDREMPKRMTALALGDRCLLTWLTIEQELLRHPIQCSAYNSLLDAQVLWTAAVCASHSYGESMLTAPKKPY